MTHPFQSTQPKKYRQVFVPLLGLTVILILIFSAIPLNPGLVQFELNAEQVLKSWDEAAKTRAAFSIGLDFLFLVVYSTTISFACVWATKVFASHKLPLASVGIILAWGQWLAALLDLVENIALVRILFGYEMDFSPQIAKWCAIFKFSLIALGLLYAGVSGIFSFRASLSYKLRT